MTTREHVGETQPEQSDEADGADGADGAEPEKPEGLEEAGEPGEIEEAWEPLEPGRPWEPLEPGGAWELEESSNSWEPEEPSEPAELAEPAGAEPSEPAELAEPAGAEHSEPAEPAEAAEPTEAADPVAAVEPAGAAEGAPRRRVPPPLLAGLIAATTGIGLLLEGIAMAIAPQNNGTGQLLFWAGTIVPFTIYLFVLMRPQLGALRAVIIAIIGLYPTVIYRMSSALVLGGYDEHLHDQEVLNLLRGSGLFAPNPILRAGPYYPGLELFTGTLIRLTGTPVIVGESLAVLIARLLLVLLIYQGALLVSPSRRGASLVVVFYAVSQQFYAFNSQFAYQTLAVTFGVGGLVLLRRAQVFDSSPVLSGKAPIPRSFWVAVLALVATVVTHHITGVLTLVFLFAWTASTPKSRRKLLTRASVIAGTAGLIWTAALATHLLTYFDPILSSMAQSAQQVLQGSTGHQMFGASGGAPANPPWESALLVLYELGCVAAAAACGWIMLRSALRSRNRMLAVLGLCDLMFPLTGVSHFDPSVGAIGDRASTFLFFPLALSLSLVIRRDPRVARPGKRPRDLYRPIAKLILIGGTVLIYAGSLVLGSGGDWSRLPGPYLVAAENRSQDPVTLAAVRWAAEHLPPGSTVVADRIPADLLEARARLWTVGQPKGTLVPSWLYFSNTWDYQDSLVVKGMDIEYLYVDERLADSLPYSGFYIEQGETHVPTRLTKAQLDKFATVKGLKAVYHNGPVSIYSTYGLGVKPARFGFTGYNSMGAGPADALFGAMAVLLLFFFFFRRRLSWLRAAAREVGGVGTATAIVAASIFIGAVLLGLRVMPGPAFTLGALGTAAVIFVLRRRQAGEPLHLRPKFRFKVNWLIVFGVVAGIAGLVICLRASWITDVSDVNAVLRLVSR